METTPGTGALPTTATTPAGRVGTWSPATCSVARRCRLEAGTLWIPPFTLQMLGQRFVSHAALAIDLDTVQPGHYRVTAVHNFQVEDTDPNLERCVAGIFLARRADDGEWEQPEQFPVECRALRALGELAIAPPSVVRLGQ